MGAARSTSATSPSDASGGPLYGRVRIWAYLSFVVALGAFLRGLRLLDAPRGYLVFNEHFYLSLASSEQTRGAFEWFLRPFDVNNPPLYNGLFSTLVRAQVPAVAAGRLVSVAAGLAAVVLVFLLCRIIFDDPTALVAAAVYAVMPGVVLLSRNIQVDSLFVALMLAGVLFYVRAARFRRARDAVVGGICLGLAALTKQPAVIALLALGIWRTWAHGGLGWLRERTNWAYLLAMGVVTGAWYGIQFATGSERMLASLGTLASRPEMSSLGMVFWHDLFAVELAWMLFPPFAVVGVWAVGFMAVCRSMGDRLVLVFVGVLLLYYVRFHFHSYYLLPVAPFVAIAVGRVATAAFGRGPRSFGAARFVLVGALIAASAFASIMMLSGQKWGRLSPMALSLKPDSGYSGVRLFYDPRAEGFFGPLHDVVGSRYSPQAATLDEFLSAPPEAGTQDLYLAGEQILMAPEGPPAKVHAIPKEEWVRPVLFGYAIGQRVPGLVDTGYFANARWRVEAVGPLWWFGFHTTSLDSTYYLYAADDLRSP